MVLRCDSCDEPGHAACDCPHFCGRQRIQARPSRQELARNRADDAAAPTLIEALVVEQPGRNLDCFYHTVVAGLQRMGHLEAPRTVPALRTVIGQCLRSTSARSLTSTSGGETLQRIAESEGTTLQAMAHADVCNQAVAPLLAWVAQRRALLFRMCIVYMCSAVCSCAGLIR